MLNKSRRLLWLMRYTYRGRRFTSTFIKQGRSQTPESLSSTHEISSSTLNDATSQSSLKQIALVPARIHRHLFGDGPIPMNVSNDIYENLDLPKLYSEDLQKHFYKLGEMQIHDYRKQLELAATMQSIPEMPKQWLFESGWTKYSSNIGNYEKVEYPDESLLFFDVEVCLNDGQLPTLAIALSPTNWYSWCSDRLVHNTPVPDLCRLHHLIPLERSGGSNRAAIVIGHNVAYDRSRVREQYLRNQTGTRFWDTMSMAIPIYGMADHQLLLYEKNDLEEDERGHNGWIDDWKARVSKNSLAALHEKLCSHKSKLTVNKSMQSFFVNEPIDEIRDNFQDLVQYCAEDVLACLELYQALYPEFVKRFPHPITWQGMLEMSAVYLPITSNWRYFYRNCEEEASNENRQAAQDVIRAARHLTNTLQESQRFKEDAWMWQEDWSKRNCTMPTWYTTLLRSKQLANLPIEQLNASDVKLRCRVIPRLFGLCWGPYPLHFKADKGWGFLVPRVDIDNAEAIAELSRASLRRGEEVNIPNRAILDVINENIINGVGDILLGEPVCTIGAFDFHKLPHPKGGNANVGDPLAKDFRIEIEEGILKATRYIDEFRAIVTCKKTTRFWGNYRARFNEQVTVWLDEEGNEGAIAPSVIPAGTITRRAVHKLWLTAINPKDNEMIGTGLKSMVECGEGWNLVGADVDSQEQWIAALFGDCAIGKHTAGATPFSNMLLAGNKADRSDLHSVVAKEVGISRDKAKVLNYARLYGSGMNHAMEFLKQSGLNDEQALRISEKLFATTKGRSSGYIRLSSDINEHFRYFLENICGENLRKNYIFLNERYFLPDYRTQKGKLTQAFEDWISSEVEERLYADGHKDFRRDILIDLLYDNNREVHTLFTDGFESATFNYLELMVGEREPRTAILDCRLGYALEPLPENVPDREYFLAKYKRSIINWMVQSSAVDFLHMLLVCMRWLCDEYEINARFVISIHDEIRYLVASEDRYRCALALALSNMYVRAAISQKLGIHQLPLSVAFFSQVDIDHVLRKEVNLICRTPDGKEVPPGEAVDMKTILEKTGGSLRKELLVKS